MSIFSKAETARRNVDAIRGEMVSETVVSLSGFKQKVEQPLFGVSAEFDDTDAIVEAAKSARAAGYTRMDAYTPMPVEGLSEALNFRDKFVPIMMLCGGLTGGTCGYLLQWFAQVNSYPINVGGKPLHSWPMQLVITFECTILFTALTGVFGMILLNGLPQLYHSIFNAPNIERASTDRFFLCVESRDPKFKTDEVVKFLEGQRGVLRVATVER